MIQIVSGNDFRRGFDEDRPDPVDIRGTYEIYTRAEMMLYKSPVTNRWRVLKSRWHEDRALEELTKHGLPAYDIMKDDKLA